MASLFDPIQVGDIQLKNRVVMVPLTRNRSPGAVPNTLNVTYYEQRASAGLCVACGYNLTGNTSGTCPECGKEIPDRTAPPM